MDSSRTALAPEWFARPTVEIATSLLGCLLEHDGCGGIICETEAYLADDEASHSFKGKTARNAAMFGPAGTAYVYSIYGLHRCLNVVTAPEGVGEAVLIRALIPTVGMQAMEPRRGTNDQGKLCSGPGNVCAALAIDLEHNGHPLWREPLTIRETERRSAPFIASPRIGISKGKELPLRFRLA